MVPRKYRLPLRALPLFFKQSSLIKRPHFLVRYQASSTLLGKVAVVVGKKVSKKAVVRNRLKRQVMAQIFSQVLTQRNLTYDVVVIVLPTILLSKNKPNIQDIITCLNTEL